MTETAQTVRPAIRCKGCGNGATTLQCPTCLKLGIKDSFFCSQDCFKKNWNTHKALHKSAQQVTRTPRSVYNPFPLFAFTGSVRPFYPLSPRRTVPKSIQQPDYADTGVPTSERMLNRAKVDILDSAAQQAMRKVCKLSRQVLDIIAAEVRPGVTTDYLDDVCHKACLERNSYPSPLNYRNFPKSLCTSPNEIVCHGIPDQRILLDGDILNLDVSIYHEGYHADLNETYYVGDEAKADPDNVRLVETTRECLDTAIKIVKPGTPIRQFGEVIEKLANERGCSVVSTWGGHGINTNFHPPPWIPHYAKNKAVGTCKAGMAFTIEPILALGSPKEMYWPDKWTNATVDGKRTAQFEHTLLVTDDGVEVLTARTEKSPGGPIPMSTLGAMLGATTN